MKKTSAKEPLIQALTRSIELIGTIFPVDAYMFVCDVEGVVRGFKAAKFLPFTVRVGEKIAPASIAESILRGARFETRILPADNYGIEVRVIGLPILEEEVLVGALTIGVNKILWECMLQSEERWQESQ